MWSTSPRTESSMRAANARAPPVSRDTRELPGVQRAKDALRGTRSVHERSSGRARRRVGRSGKGSKDQLHRRAQHRVDATERGGVTRLDRRHAIDAGVDRPDDEIPPASDTARRKAPSPPPSGARIKISTPSSTRPTSSFTVPEASSQDRWGGWECGRGGCCCADKQLRRSSGSRPWRHSVPPAPPRARRHCESRDWVSKLSTASPSIRYAP
jgi:hypothetical protein